MKKKHLKRYIQKAVDKAVSGSLAPKSENMSKNEKLRNCTISVGGTVIARNVDVEIKHKLPFLDDMDFVGKAATAAAFSLSVPYVRNVIDAMNRMAEEAERKRRMETFFNPLLGRPFPVIFAGRGFGKTAAFKEFQDTLFNDLCRSLNIDPDMVRATEVPPKRGYFFNPINTQVDRWGGYPKPRWMWDEMTEGPSFESIRYLTNRFKRKMDSERMIYLSPKQFNDLKAGNWPNIIDTIESEFPAIDMHKGVKVIPDPIMNDGHALYASKQEFDVYKHLVKYGIDATKAAKMVPGLVKAQDAIRSPHHSDVFDVAAYMRGASPLSNIMRDWMFEKPVILRDYAIFFKALGQEKDKVVDSGLSEQQARFRCEDRNRRNKMGGTSYYFRRIKDSDLKKSSYTVEKPPLVGDRVEVLSHPNWNSPADKAVVGKTGTVIEVSSPGNEPYTWRVQLKGLADTKVFHFEELYKLP